MSENYIVIITGPSGVGKSALLERLVGHGWSKCITCTTRRPRSYEKDGIDYHFLEEDFFEDAKSQGLFMETNRHYGHSYGLRHEDINRHLQEGHVVVLLNWEGAQKIEMDYKHSVVVHIDPPSMDVLESRLAGREDTQRLQYAKDDMHHSSQFQHRIINDDLDKATSRLLILLEEIVPST